MRYTQPISFKSEGKDFRKDEEYISQARTFLGRMMETFSGDQVGKMWNTTLGDGTAISAILPAIGMFPIVTINSPVNVGVSDIIKPPPRGIVVLPETDSAPDGFGPDDSDKPPWNNPGELPNYALFKPASFKLGYDFLATVDLPAADDSWRDPDDPAKVLHASEIVSGDRALVWLMYGISRYYCSPGSGKIFEVGKLLTTAPLSVISLMVYEGFLYAFCSNGSLIRIYKRTFLEEYQNDNLYHVDNEPNGWILELDHRIPRIAYDTLTLSVVTSGVAVSDPIRGIFTCLVSSGRDEPLGYIEIDLNTLAIDTTNQILDLQPSIPKQNPNFYDGTWTSLTGTIATEIPTYYAWEGGGEDHVIYQSGIWNIYRWDVPWQSQTFNTGEVPIAIEYIYSDITQSYDKKIATLSRDVIAPAYTKSTWYKAYYTIGPIGTFGRADPCDTNPLAPNYCVDKVAERDTLYNAVIANFDSISDFSSYQASPYIFDEDPILRSNSSSFTDKTTLTIPGRSPILLHSTDYDSSTIGSGGWTSKIIAMDLRSDTLILQKASVEMNGETAFEADAPPTWVEIDYDPPLPTNVDGNYIDSSLNITIPTDPIYGDFDSFYNEISSVEHTWFGKIEVLQYPVLDESPTLIYTRSESGGNTGYSNDGWNSVDSYSTPLMKENHNVDPYALNGSSVNVYMKTPDNLYELFEEYQVLNRMTSAAGHSGDTLISLRESLVVPDSGGDYYEGTGYYNSLTINRGGYRRTNSRYTSPDTNGLVFNYYTPHEFEFDEANGIPGDNPQYTKQSLV